MTTVTYPGVYIAEEAPSFISINTVPTSVPVFACSNSEYSQLANEVATRVVSERQGEAVSNVSAGTSGTSAPDFYRFDSLLDLKSTGLSYRDSTIGASLFAYFSNGGGYCYVVKTEGLESVVPTLADVSLLVAAGQDISSAAAALCNGPGQFIFGILDVPSDKTLTTTNVTNVNVALGNLEQTAAYYPWLKASWSDRIIPPSAAIAGVYCSVDRDRGPWKAPANVQLQGGLIPEVGVSDIIQGAYTALPNAINMIRHVGNRASVVWGARTRSENTQWMHIPVRRLFNSIEKDLRQALTLSLFEPNNESTWEITRSAISNYLHSLWVAGALQGGTEKEAYFVHVGKGVTMNDEDIRQGKLIVKIGVAAARPAEFIVLSMSQDVMPG
ncbi:phage tail sheath family protein [Pseudomonas koreensis]|uniref:phage tail sheath family protein n=1 Tax=Pseudomonas koreensis TaxID=198620 RepID=UPI003F853377